MPQDCNPFSGADYSSPEVYVDRDGIVSKIVQGLRETANDNPENFMILGERRMGKTSTLNYIRLRLTESLDDGYRLLSVVIRLQNDCTRRILIESIERDIRIEIATLNYLEKSKFKLRQLLGVISQINILGTGVSGNLQNTTCNDITELADFVARNSNKASLAKEGLKSGIVFMLDETDRAPNELELGEFLWITNQAIRDNKCKNTCFIVSGRPQVEAKLIESHDSIDDLFSRVRLNNLDKNQTIKLLKNGISSANRKRHTNNYTRIITMEDGIMGEIYTVTNGRPDLVQKLASSMYTYAKEDLIKLTDLQNCPKYISIMNSNESDS
jgi:AAA+ ATPase superfamily predicted ATPase